MNDLAMRWLQEHDPDAVALDDDEYSKKHGIITPKVANRTRKREVRFDVQRNDHHHHCGQCQSRDATGNHTVL